MRDKETVVVLGASRKPERYSNMAVSKLLEKDYTVIPVNPSGGTIFDLEVVKHLEDIDTPVDTVTVYLNPQALLKLSDEILSLSPRRVIFNPGTETPELQEQLEQNGIECLQACTLVLLGTSQF